MPVGRGGGRIGSPGQAPGTGKHTGAGPKAHPGAFGVLTCDVLPTCALRQEALRAVSSITKLVWFDASSVPVNLMVTVWPAKLDRSKVRWT